MSILSMKSCNSATIINYVLVCCMIIFLQIFAKLLIWWRHTVYIALVRIARALLVCSMNVAHNNYVQLVVFEKQHVQPTTQHSTSHPYVPQWLCLKDSSHKWLEHEKDTHVIWKRNRKQQRSFAKHKGVKATDRNPQPSQSSCRQRIDEYTVQPDTE